MNTRVSAAVLAHTIAWGLLVGTLAAPTAFAENPGDFLVPTGATWRYLDNGSDQGTAWRATAFADGSWAQGPAKLGYGDGKIDWDGGAGMATPDPECATAFRSIEAPGCGLGAELVVALPLVAALRRRARIRCVHERSDG